MFDPPLAQISALDLAARRAAPEPLQLIDVREPEELAIVHLDPCIHLPLSRFAEWSEQVGVQLDPQAETVVLCHHGIRSAQMCRWLQQQGFAQVKNLAGGIDAYAEVVDPSLARY